MMAFEHFLTWRANQHGRVRYNLIKSLDPNHIVALHAAHPSPLYGGSEKDHAINRGNDWFFSDHVDRIGCSAFPTWLKIDDAGFAMHVEFVKSASGNKAFWLSELQGGSAANGFENHQAVEAISQQRWIWTAIACGADTILFWCWRDEVFGRESSGYGLAGDDGLAEERLSAMKVTGSLIEEYRELLAAYKPTKPEVGVMFSPQSYYLNWAQEGNSDLCMQALQGYIRCLVRKSIPFTVIEEQHLKVISELKIILLPRVIVVDKPVEEALINFVKEGGTLVCESECGAFNSTGFYRYPVDRFTSRMSGIHEIGRRGLDADTIKVEIEGRKLNLGITQWLTPWHNGKERVLANGKDGALVIEVPIGKGRLILCGVYLGDAYFRNRTADFEDFLELLVHQAGWEPEIQVVSPLPKKASFVYTRSGESNGKRLIFVFFPTDCNKVRLRFKPDFFPLRRVKDLVTGKDVSLSNTANGQKVTLYAPELKLSILVER